ncbi:MAG TPA: thrombospondin type 3 repeat-containing protein, partial [bacterium]|nr:thrombospondin type 3 repeat-containing protein [bacterium]
GDGIGNICDGGPKDSAIWIPVKNKEIPLLSFIHDYDEDGIANTVDNCPKVKNPYMETAIHNEMISGVCKNGYQLNNDGTKSCLLNGDGGAIYDKKMSKSVFVETGSCFEMFIPFWQSDSDLDGIGDACDHEEGVTYSGNIVESDEAGSFSLEVKTAFTDVDDPARKKNCRGYQSSTCYIPIIKNRYIDASVNMNTMPKEKNSPNSTTETLTQKYCWVDNFLLNRWGDDGFCTTTEGDGLRVITPEMKYLPVYGYSHGSDPKPLNFEFDENWKDPHWKDGETTKKCKKSCVFTWDWRENLESEYYDLYDGYVIPVDEGGEDGSKDSFITYVFSSGVQSSEDQKYMTGEGAAMKINPLHFKNKRIYARSKRDTFGGTDISYYRGEIFEQHPFYFGWFDIDSYLQRFGISPWWWMTGPGMPFEHDWIDVYRNINGRIGLVEKDMSAAKIAGIADSVFVGRDNITGIFSFNANSNQKVLMTTRDSDTAWSVGAIIEMPHYAGAVHKMAELIPGQDFLLMDSSSVYRFNTMSGFGDVNQPSFRVCSVNIQVGEIGRLPFNGAMAEIIKLGNRVLIINKNAGELELYELDMVQGMVIPLEYENGPSGRAHFNFEVINGTLYVAGGAEISGTQILPLSDVYKFSFENGWTTVAQDTGLNLMGAVIAPDNGFLKVYSRPFTKTGRIHVALIDENTGEINLDTEIIEGGGIIRQDYCIDDNGIDLFPGIEGNGICRKVEKNDYEYSSYTFLDYKMSLAGSGNNLYIGGLTGVRRMEIGNDSSLKMKELVLAGHITSIAVTDDRLFGASVDSIKVFKLGSDGSVKFDRSVKASGCKDLRIRGDLLFAGMEGKVSVYDISNGKINLIKNISVENNVEDLEIAGNNLFVYHEKGFWFWKKNALTKFDISDLNNTVRIGNRNMECDDAEMMKDESHVYLGCANGQFRIDRNVSGLSVETVNGKKNYFRDSYVNDGIIYTVHSGRLFMSR